MPSPFRFRVQRADGSPVAGAVLTVALKAEPFSKAGSGTVKLAPVRLTTDADGLIAADLFEGTLSVGVREPPQSIVTGTVEHTGDASTPAPVPAIAVSGARTGLDGSPAESPVTFTPVAVQVLGRVLVTRDPVTVAPVAGLVTVALVPGTYVASQPGERAGLVQVPGDWLEEVLGVPALWGGDETTWGAAPAAWEIAA